jgi:glyoxylate reductase
MSRIVVTGKIPAAGLALLRAEPAVEVVAWDGDEPMERAALLAFVRGANGLVTLLTERVDAELLEAAGPQLKAVSNVAVGYNNIDVPACQERNVIVTNTPGVLTDATADIAMALILMTTRRLAEGERIIRSRTKWQWGMFYLLGSGIQGRRLGIIGMGTIGQALARRARAFGMEVVYSNRNPVAPSIQADLRASMVTLDELLATSDIVSVNCPYGPATHHLVDSVALAKFKPTAFLINTARGPIVDEVALVNALEQGQLAGAGLDVFEHEPIVHEGLLDRDDVVLIPHLGSATLETRDAMAALAARNAIAIHRGEPAITPVHP